MDMNETVKDRLLNFLQHLGIGQNKFEKAVGLSVGYINKLRHEPSPTKLRLILNKYPELNQNWLLTGEGSMLQSQDSNHIESNAVPFVPERHVLVPVVSSYAYAGYLTGYADPEYMEALPTIDFTPEHEMHGNYVAFEVRGDSMDDGSKESYINGELVICREVERSLWQDCKLHINRRDFVIVHQEGILIKRIIEHDVAACTIIIHSLNPEYPDRTLNLSEVLQIFSVVESRIQRKR